MMIILGYVVLSFIMAIVVYRVSCWMNPDLIIFDDDRTEFCIIFVLLLLFWPAFIVLGPILVLLGFVAGLLYNVCHWRIR